MKKKGVILFIFILTIQALMADKIQIDKSFLDWLPISTIAYFSKNFNPVYFNREAGGVSDREPIDQAVYWQKAGTGLKEMRAVISGSRIYLYLESHTNFARNTSIFLYFYTARRGDTENVFTLEIIPGTDSVPGTVLIWEKGRNHPQEIGTLANTSFALELSIPLTAVPEPLAGQAENVSFDVSTCYFDQSAGVYEEFFFTSIYLKDIMHE